MLHIFLGSRPRFPHGSSVNRSDIRHVAAMRQQKLVLAFEPWFFVKAWSIHRACAEPKLRLLSYVMRYDELEICGKCLLARNLLPAAQVGLSCTRYHTSVFQTRPIMKFLTIDPKKEPSAPTRDFPSSKTLPENLPLAKEVNVHPTKSGSENASLFFVGTATTILEWEGLRLMTDPNFLHAGDHVHLGPGVTGTRQTNPAVDLHDLPNIHLVLLSHYHADHFDQEVEESLRRDLPIITTPHAKESLTGKGEEESFNQVFDLDFFEFMMVNIGSSSSSGKIPRIKVAGMPGKHVPDGVIGAANDLLKAVRSTSISFFSKLSRIRRSSSVLTYPGASHEWMDGRARVWLCSE